MKPVRRLKRSLKKSGAVASVALNVDRESFETAADGAAKVVGGTADLVRDGVTVAADITVGALDMAGDLAGEVVDAAQSAAEGAADAIGEIDLAAVHL